MRARSVGEGLDGCGAGGGLVFGLEARVLAAGDDEVVSDRGGLGAHEGSDALPAQPEPVHQHPFGVRSAPQPPVHDGSSCHGAGSKRSSVGAMF